MTRPRDHLEISARAVALFGNDGKLDAHELDQLVAIAERDGKFDADEVRVLKGVIDRIQPHELTESMRARLAALSSKLSQRT